MYNAPFMQIKRFAPALLALGMLLSACGAKPATYVGVMIDNHEDARPFQHGLDDAAWVQEQFVEGFITRFEAVFDTNDLPESVGPVRSVRPYFVDGSSAIVSAIFHVGGSPEALDKLAASKTVTSFNALLGYNEYYGHNPEAPAPHHRTITAEKIEELLGKIKTHEVEYPFSTAGEFTSEESVDTFEIDYHSKIHDITYTYSSWSGNYTRTNRDEVQASAAKNILILETPVEVVGPVGRLGITMLGSGRAMLFRDGGVVHGKWKKTSNDTFFTFTDTDGKEFSFHSGQTWMIVLDSLNRVSW
jgi:hypothetical protein